jgi:hypothetical protein
MVYVELILRGGRPSVKLPTFFFEDEISGGIPFRRLGLFFEK